MKNFTIILAVFALVLSNLACRTLVPGPKTTGQYESICRESVSGVNALRANLEFPKHFQDEHPVKQGGEFDPNSYFDVLTHLKMQPGYSLDYVYMFDGMGGLPLLYARALDQAPFGTDSDYFAAKPPDYRSSVEVDDSAEGYLQFAILSEMAPQFYLFWHANYNNIQVLCGSSDIESVIEAHKKDDFGLPLDAMQVLKARSISHPDPEIVLEADQVVVKLVIFTDWGGFLRRTYTISRAFPHELLDVQDEILVEYNCGIMF